MTEFTRKPSQLERVVAIALTSVLMMTFSCLSLLFAYFGNWLAATVSGVLFLGSVALFHGTAFSAPRALHSKEIRIAAWGLLIIGVTVAMLIPFLDGSITQRLMTLGSALTLIAAGGAGIRS